MDGASAAPMTDAPDLLGTFHSANITSHPVAGARALEDKESAR